MPAVALDTNAALTMAGRGHSILRAQNHQYRLSDSWCRILVNV